MQKALVGLIVGVALTAFASMARADVYTYDVGDSPVFTSANTAPDPGNDSFSASDFGSGGFTLQTWTGLVYGPDVVPNPSGSFSFSANVGTVVPDVLGGYTAPISNVGLSLLLVNPSGPTPINLTVTNATGTMVTDNGTTDFTFLDVPITMGPNTGTTNVDLRVAGDDVYNLADGNFSPVVGVDVYFNAPLSAPLPSPKYLVPGLLLCLGVLRFYSKRAVAAA